MYYHVHNGSVSRRIEGKESRKSIWWGWHVHTTIFKIDNQQGSIVYHRELCLVFCNNQNGKRFQKRIVCITESLCCTPETNTTLLINDDPV